MIFAITVFGVEYATRLIEAAPADAAVTRAKAQRAKVSAMRILGMELLQSTLSTGFVDKTMHEETKSVK
jgi:hypothetical protein